MRALDRALIPPALSAAAEPSTAAAWGKYPAMAKAVAAAKEVRASNVAAGKAATGEAVTGGRPPRPATMPATVAAWPAAAESSDSDDSIKAHTDSADEAA